MVDFLKQELQIGDWVVYLMHSKTSAWFEKGRIIRMTDKYICLDTGRRKLPEHAVKVTKT